MNKKIKQKKNWEIAEEGRERRNPKKDQEGLIGQQLSHSKNFEKMKN